MDFYNEASNFIKKYEGYASKAKWDVNAYRLGHGSDTITLSDGTFRKVKQGDVTTRDLAAKDLTRRIKLDFEPTVKRQIGEPYYSNLPNTAKIALLSIAYNYGSITKPEIINAAKTGDTTLLANAIVDSTKNDNYGKSYYNSLKDRRLAEANFAKTITDFYYTNKTAINYGTIGAILLGLTGYFYYLKKKKII
jgi:GH24 family phage-related lysozyme (muramidase)